MATKPRITRRRFLIAGAGALAGVTVAGGGTASARFVQGSQRVEEVWATTTVAKLEKIGTVKRLVILPLVEWYTGRDDLVGEPGLSYLVRADDTTILFDVGFNLQQQHPSPLLRNAAALGVDLQNIDALVISHPHTDHIGGASQVSLSGQPVDLGSVPAYLPCEIGCPTSQKVVVEGPRLLAPGVASLGIIPRQDFVFGWTPEQSLAVNVAGKGIVLVVGCGHPTIQRIVERAEALFAEPLYGVVGGLHFPVTDSRAKLLGIPAQKSLGTGKWPWDPINQDDVRSAIAFLQARRPQLVALSAHDSCDWSIEAFRQAFAEAHREVRVGREIVVES